MKKTLLILAALTLSAALWAQTINSVAYIDANGQPHTADNVTVVTDASDPVTWGVAEQTTWYVVQGADITLAKGAVCYGTVHLILADGAKLMATGQVRNAGIQTSGDANSLTRLHHYQWRYNYSKWWRLCC